MPSPEPHFDIHPSVVLKLGEELIHDEFTAIVEAVKNSYDAGATRIRIAIDTDNVPEQSLKSRYPAAKGTIIISDDGDGMDSDDINGGWLLISYSRKKDARRQMSRTHTRRMPLGDKGIGRLGLQRLGNNVEVFTATGPNTQYHLSFTWKDFETATKLSDVTVTILPPERTLKKGTDILVSDLKMPDLWKGQLGRDRLQSKLSQVVSPFDALRECTVDVTLNGTSLGLAQFSRQVLSAAELRCRFEFDGTKFKITAEYTLDYIKLALESKADVLEKVTEDEGRAFATFLKSSNAAIAADLSYNAKGRARLLASRTVDLDAMGDTALVAGKPASPGPFAGEFFHFDRRERAQGFELANDFKAFLDTQRGIRIYRNGFVFGRYGVDGNDWLNLGDSWTSGRGYYGLKPANVLGYVRISATDNPLLVEKTDREGLTDTAAATNFLRLVKEVPRYVNDVSNHIRRGLIEYGKTLALADSDEPDLDSEVVDKKLGKARQTSRRIKNAAANKSGTAPQPTTEDAEEIDKAVALGQALATEVDRLQLELRTTMDLAALGLTAEALSHEIGNIADQLAQRTKTISSVITKTRPDAQVVEYVEYVRHATNALRKQLAHLAPALRFVREKRQEFDIREFMTGVEEFFRQRLADKGISLKVETGSQPFVIRASKGKLTQVVDNLILNSEYWLSEQLRKEPRRPAFLRIRIKHPHVLISDSGPGIDPSIEAKLFQPFVTLKAKGRGLGLFIVRQLLDSMGCSISLRTDRNQSGARYVFDLDLSGALLDGEGNDE
jgi:signal transduction histidine kinase